jgi:uncharacterized protein with LGFP repeats
VLLNRHSLVAAVAGAAIFAGACSNAAGTIETSPTQSTARIATSAGMVLVNGEILKKYQAVGGPDGSLGLPVGGEQPAPDGGRRQIFAGGAIYWSPHTGAHIVRGAIRTAWEFQYGGAGGALGYPTSDPEPLPGGSRSQFQRGTVTDTGGQLRVDMH